MAIGGGLTLDFRWFSSHLRAFSRSSKAPSSWASKASFRIGPNVRAGFQAELDQVATVQDGSGRVLFEVHLLGGPGKDPDAVFGFGWNREEVGPGCRLP